MKRVLTFDGPKASKRFELLRIALLSGGDGKQPRTREVLRGEARLLDALDTISVEQGADNRILHPSLPQTISIGQDDWVLLSTYADTTLWAPKIAREVVDLQDWLSAADKVDS